MAEYPRSLFKRLTQALFEEVKHPVAAGAPQETGDAAETDAVLEFAAPAPAPVDLIAQMDEQAAAERPPERLPIARAAAQAKFEVRLARMLEDRPQSVAGKLQLLDLDSLKAHVGARWQEVADRAALIAEQVMSRRLAATDVFAPYEETGFIMLFAELNEQQAKLKAAAIAREIRERLVGELGGEDSGEDKSWVKAFVGSIPEIVTGSAPDLATIDAALGRTPDVAPPPSTHHTDPELKRRVGEIGIIFRPTLFVARKMLSIYDCRAQRLDMLDHLHTGAHAYWRGDAPMIFEIDRSVLQMALRQIRAAAETPPASLVQVSLHASSLLAISGGQLVDLCHCLDQPLRRQLVIEIAGAGIGGALNPRLGEAVQLIHPFCRSVIARVKPGFTDLERLARHGFVSVGMDLDDPEIYLAPGMLKVDVLPLARLARVAKLQSYLYGIPTPEIAQAARAAGFDYLNGPAIGAETAEPAPLQVFGGAA